MLEVVVHTIHLPERRLPCETPEEAVQTYADVMRDWYLDDRLDFVEIVDGDRRFGTTREYGFLEVTYSLPLVEFSSAEVQVTPRPA